MKQNIDAYISELLYLHDCVIIPDFGGFVGNKKCSVLNKKSRTIHPPSKQILFNKNLITNDGLLVSYIANSEKISNNQSTAIIDNFVQKIKIQLKENGTFRIEKVGLLSMGSDNNILFLQDSFTNYNLDSFGMSSKKVSKVNHLEKQVTKIIHPISTKNGQRKIWRAAAVLIPIIGISLISITQEEKINDIYSQMADLNPFSVLNNKEIVIENLDNQVAIPISKNDLKNIRGSKESIIPPKNEKSKNTSELKKEKKKILKKRFFLIAGSFGVEENAKALVKNLRSENYNAFIVGKNENGLIRVCYDKFASKEEATAVLMNLKSDNKSAWILSQ